jgi:hypothetical protein
MDRLASFRTCVLRSLRARARPEDLVCLVRTLCALAVSACVFRPPEIPSEVPFDPRTIPESPLVEGDSTKIFEDPGNLVIYHGFGCADSNRSGAQTILRVKQSQEIPDMLDDAAVILNGWQFRYLEGDHELMGLVTGIGEIEKTAPDHRNTRLEWHAYGAISDHNFDDPYHWCYRFTVFAWKRDAYEVYVDQQDSHFFEGNASRGEGPFGWETALSFQPAFVEVSPSGGSAGAMILPRGFGFAWTNGDDHNLLQLAYNLDPGAGFIADGKRYATPHPAFGGVDQIGRTFYTWETKRILKDNALRRDYRSGEIVSVASGSGVAAVSPPFTIVPFEDHGNCVSLEGTDSESRTILSVPFDVAIPVLTGWDLAYVCGDRHVEEIGVWIDDVAYHAGEPGPSTNGRIDYTVHYILHDRDRGDANHFRHRVSVLGLRRIPPPGLVTPAPSLSVLPEVLRFPYPDQRGRPSTIRSVLMNNFGNAPADRTTIAISGPDAARFRLLSQHPATRTLDPGASEQFTLRLAVPCAAPLSPGDSWNAILHIDTSEGPFEVPLLGQPYPCVQG